MARDIALPSHPPPAQAPEAQPQPSPLPSSLLSALSRPSPEHEQEQPDYFSPHRHRPAPAHGESYAFRYPRRLPSPGAVAYEWEDRASPDSPFAQGSSSTLPDSTAPAPAAPAVGQKEPGSIPFQHPPYAHAYAPSLSLHHFLQPTRGGFALQLPASPGTGGGRRRCLPRLTQGQAQRHAYPASFEGFGLGVPGLESREGSEESGSKPSTPGGATSVVSAEPGERERVEGEEYKGKREHRERRRRGYTLYTPGLPSPTFRTYFPSPPAGSPGSGSASSASTSGSTSTTSAYTVSLSDTARSRASHGSLSTSAEARHRRTGQSWDWNSNCDWEPRQTPLAELACFGPVLPRGLWDGAPAPAPARAWGDGCAAGKGGVWVSGGARAGETGLDGMDDSRATSLGVGTGGQEVGTWDGLELELKAGPGVGRRARERRRRRRLEGAGSEREQEGVGRWERAGEPSAGKGRTNALVELTPDRAPREQGETAGAQRVGEMGERVKEWQGREREEGQAQEGERSVVTFALPRARGQAQPGIAAPALMPTTPITSTTSTSTTNTMMGPLRTTTDTANEAARARDKGQGEKQLASEARSPNSDSCPKEDHSNPCCASDATAASDTALLADLDPDTSSRTPRSSSIAPEPQPDPALTPTPTPTSASTSIVAPASPAPTWLAVRRQRGGSWTAADLLRDVGEMRIEDLRVREVHEKEDRRVERLERLGRWDLHQQRRVQALQRQEELARAMDQLEVRDYAQEEPTRTEAAALPVDGS
ncbi:hypothetical protein CALVIDRAFT_564851 [Calocera viscosa TUFC12733]|uniref:Uncharacterized protein n=1 Tax=Calocera viscosa (strain TUFC12733) TaxID=1330018 RepID=A0A167L8T3_CALVF|nr:hypothetical protein CALVIDRAFT_564851 [Calocera viscosa TUFC12733]